MKRLGMQYAGQIHTKGWTATSPDVQPNAPFTVYTTKSATEATQMRYTTLDNDGAMFWADRGVGYVVSGGSDRERLTQVARAVYEQFEKSGG